MPPKHRISLILGAFALVSVGCANRGEDTAPVVTTTAPTESSAAPTTDVAPAITFGDIESPCGPAPDGVTPSVAATESGGPTDVLRLATASDKGNVAVPGLNGEMYDAAMAFSAWCNEQGGIAGLPVEIIDADAKLFEVPAQMENICANAFAMVGGGFAFDDQEFPRFHECNMIDFAGFVVSTGKSLSDNMVSPMPNPSNQKDGGWFKWAVATHPDAMQHFATVYSDILTSQIVEQQYVEIAEQLGGVDVVQRISYNSLGEVSWVPIAQQLKSSGVRALSFIGVPEVLPPLTKAMEEINYEPELIMVDAGFYADVLLNRGGSSVDGVVIRTGYALFEEADRVQAVRDYLDMMADYRPEGKVAGLGMQSMSALMLFASVAKQCVVDNGELTRGCIMDNVAKVTEWTGGGLHGPSSPGTNTPSPCYLMIEVKGGQFTRLYPPLEPTDADRALIPSTEITPEGWACDPSTLVKLDGDYGDQTLGKKPA